MTDYSYPCAVIGAGVIGLSIARELAMRGLDVIVLESAEQIGSETSSRNSEVIHAGIYYPSGSHKARFCVQGKELLYQYVRERGIAHRQCGKLIVATEESQIGALDVIQSRAIANGVLDLQYLDQHQVRDLEPEVRAVKGLLSPSTGIVDSHQLMLSLQGEAEASGVVIALNSPVMGGTLKDQGILLDVGGEQACRLQVQFLVNAAGHGAPRLAQCLQGYPASLVPVTWFAKGSYFSLAAPAPFKHLVYPVPEPGGLGVHLTLDLAGQARFGPDVEWTDKLDYRVDAARANSFYQAIRQYWPGLQDGALVPAYAGVRPKISGPEEPAADFLIQGPAEHGISGLVHLFGIESPGLTSCLALAREVADRLQL